MDGQDRLDITHYSVIFMKVLSFFSYDELVVLNVDFERCDPSTLNGTLRRVWNGVTNALKNQKTLTIRMNEGCPMEPELMFIQIERFVNLRNVVELRLDVDYEFSYAECPVGTYVYDCSGMVYLRVLTVTGGLLNHMSFTTKWLWQLTLKGLYTDRQLNHTAAFNRLMANLPELRILTIDHIPHDANAFTLRNLESLSLEINFSDTDLLAKLTSRYIESLRYLRLDVFGRNIVELFERFASEEKQFKKVEVLSFHMMNLIAGDELFRLPLLKNVFPALKEVNFSPSKYRTLSDTICLCDVEGVREVIIRPDNNYKRHEMDVIAMKQFLSMQRGTSVFRFDDKSIESYQPFKFW